MSVVKRRIFPESFKRCGPALKRAPATTASTDLICISNLTQGWGAYRRLSGPQLVATFLH